MILPLVAELLARVGRQREAEEAFERVRRGMSAVAERRARAEARPGTAGKSAAACKLAGLTDPAKALVAALAVQALLKPAILLVESNERADALLPLARYFLRALGKLDAQVMVLPAHEVLPYRSEERRVGKECRSRGLAEH